jgi:hypothetical protein
MKIIQASQIRGNFFGGMPFDLNWAFNGGESPSKLTVSVVNEKGVYGDPSSSLGFNSLETVSVGGFTFNGYLVSYDLKKSPDKKILELTYVDKSADLDRYFVGLNERWGQKNKQNVPNLILVGKSYHPCDQDLDSTVEYTEVEGQVDPCDPCSEMPPNKYDNACDELLSEFNIYEVYYTLNDLISEIKGIFNCDFNPSVYKDYKSNHIGPLRSVLQSWCSDLGLSFVWDPFRNVLQFVNRSKKINIPTEGVLKNISDLIDLEYGGSVENTFTQGSIGYFGRQGSVESYGCEKSTLENLTCLTLGALAEDGSFNSGGGDDFSSDLAELKDYEIKELAVALSYYSSEMRDAILWFNHYEIYNAEGLKKYIQAASNGQGPSAGKLPGSKLRFFGNMEVLKVYGFNREISDEAATFSRIDNVLADSQREVLNLPYAGPETVGSLENPNYYYFIARLNEEVYEREKQRERDLANGFFGRFRIKDFETTIPNSSNSKTEVTIEGPDGNGGWYYKNSQLKNLNIFDFGHEEGSYISLLDNEIANAESEYDQKLNEYIRDLKQKEFIVKGFILHEREPKWFPDKDFAKWFQSLFDWYEAQTPRKFAQSDGRPEILFDIYPESLTDPSIRLYIARLGSLDVYSVTSIVQDSTQHPQEAPKKPTKNQIEQDIFGEINIKEICNYGLGDRAKFLKITLGKKKDMEIFTPVEAFERTSPDVNTNVIDNVLFGERPLKGSGTGYDVVATAKSNFQIYFPKFEYVKQFSANNINFASNVIYHYEDIKEDNLNFFRQNKGKKGSLRSNCQIDEKEVDKYMQKANKFTHYNMTDVQNRASFRIAGAFATSFNVLQGLSNVSIIVNDNGVFTDYVLEDKVITPPSINILEQNLKNYIPIKRTKNQGSISPINKTNIKQYQNAIRNV